MLSKSQLSRLKKKPGPRDLKFPAAFNALSDPNRWRMFRLIVRQPEADICVGDLARILKVTDSAASQHLKVLASAGLMAREKKGQNVCYRVRRGDPLVKAILTLIK